MAEGGFSTRASSPHSDEGTLSMEEDVAITNENIPYLLNLLKPTSNKWKDIGLQLNVKQQILDDLENNPDLVREGTIGLLRETLNSVEQPTYKQLAYALRSSKVNEESIAQSIEELPNTGVYMHETAQVEISTLIQSFQGLQSSVSKKIEDASDDLSKLLRFLVGLYPQSSIPNPMVEEMEAATNTQSLFSVLTRHGMWSYMNYHLLESIVDEYMPHDDEQKKQMKQYVAELEQFARVTSIYHYIATSQSLTTSPKLKQECLTPVDTYSPDPELFSCMTTKIELSAQLSKLSHVLELQGHLMKHFSLHHPMLLLGAISRGSVVINWYFPMVISKQVFSIVTSSSLFHKEHNIVRVTLDGLLLCSDKKSPDQQEYYVQVQHGRADVMPTRSLGSFPGEHASKSGRCPENLPEVEQRLFYTRTLCSNSSFLYQHLNTPAILVALEEKELIQPHHAANIKEYSNKHAQNTLAIYSMQLIETPPNCMDKLCDTLQTKQQSHATDRLVTGYKELVKHGYPRPSYPPLPSPAVCSKFADLSSAFLKLLTKVMDAFDGTANSLNAIKHVFSQLVLPLGDGEVVPLVDPKIYKETVTTRELFRLISPLLNCLSPHLIQLLCEGLQCLPAITALQEFTAVHDLHKKAILCIKDTHDEMNDLDTASYSAPLSPGHLKAHSLSLDALQSAHPLVFRMLDCHRVPSSKPLHTFRLSVEVNRPFISVQNYDDITNALSAVFLLPNLALVYVGCCMSPIILTWLVPAQLLPYLKSPPFESTASGDRLLAEQGVVAVAFGDDIRIKCLSLKEVQLKEAAMYGLVEWIQQLAQEGADINAADVAGFTPLHLASHNEHIAVLQALLSYDQVEVDATTRENQHTPLFIASYKGHIEVVRVLLDAGANVNNQNNKVQSIPLGIASQEGHSEVVRVLLDAGANINHQDKWGQTAVYSASAGGHVEVVKLLFQAKADIELQHKENQATPLTTASYHGHSEVVRVLLDAGANINHQDKNKLTPLMSASKAGLSEVVRVLLSRNDLHTHMQDENGQTAFDMASVEGHSEICQLIISHEI